MARRSRARRAWAAALAGAALLATAATPAEEEARRTVREVVDRVLVVLRTPELASAERRARIQAVAWEWFDFGTMSQLVVARDWRRFTPEQREAFVIEFRELLSARYGRKLDGYGQEDVEIDDTRVEPGGDVTVRTRILRPSGGSDVIVDYRLRREQDRLRAIDVVIEGVSLVFSYRGQFQGILTSNGPQGLIDRLREKNATLSGTGGD